MDAPSLNPPGQDPKAPRLQVGRQGKNVVMAINGRPIAEFSAPEAAFMAAMLIKHACAIAAGAPVVQKAIEEVYGAVDGDAVKPRTHPPAQGAG